jgi:hypothetical protein
MSVHVGFVVDKVSQGQLYFPLQTFGFPLSISLHYCSIFTYVSGGRKTGPLETQRHKHIVSHYRNSNKKSLEKNLSILSFYKENIRELQLKRQKTLSFALVIRFIPISQSRKQPSDQSRWARHVARIRETNNAYKLLAGKLEGVHT